MPSGYIVNIVFTGLLLKTCEPSASYIKKPVIAEVKLLSNDLIKMWKPRDHPVINSDVISEMMNSIR